MGYVKCSLVVLALLALQHQTLAQVFESKSANGGLFGSDDNSSPAENNGYLPPLGISPSDNSPLYAGPPKPPQDNSGREDSPTGISPNVAFPTAVQPQLGCAAALLCVEEQYCSAAGVISKTPLQLTEDQKLRGVPKVDCRNPDTGIIGKCCRDPDYVDPWPAGNLSPEQLKQGFDEQGFPKFLNLGNNKAQRPSRPSPVPVPTTQFGQVLRPQTPIAAPQQIRPQTPITAPQQLRPQTPIAAPEQLRPQTPIAAPQQPLGAPLQPIQPAYQPNQIVPDTKPSQLSYGQVSQPTFVQPKNPFLPQQPKPFQPQQPQQPYTSEQPRQPLAEFPQQAKQPEIVLVPEQPAPQPEQYQPEQPVQQPGYFQPEQVKQPSLIQPGQPQQPDVFQQPEQPSGYQPAQHPGYSQTKEQPKLPSWQDSQGTISNGIQSIIPVNKPQDTTVISAPPSNDINVGETPQTPSSFFGNGINNIPKPSLPNLSQYNPQSPPVFIAPHTPGAQCGIVNQVEQNYAGGLNDVQTPFGEIPWQAMILHKADKKLLCSGAVVAPNVVMTAAHCIYGMSPSEVSIKVGEWKLGYELKHEEPLPFEIAQVQNIEVHPGYQPGGPGSDLAMLILETPVKLDQHVDTICLPDQQPQASVLQRKCISVGWGKEVLQLHAAGALMNKLEVDTLSPDQCRTRLQGAESPLDLDDSLVCVKAHKQNNNLCQVDVGGPLACDRGDGHYELVGIYSQDTGCLPTNQVATFALIDNKWVNDMLSSPTFTVPNQSLPESGYNYEGPQPGQEAPSRIHYHQQQPDVPCDCQQGSQPAASYPQESQLGGSYQEGTQPAGSYAYLPPN